MCERLPGWRILNLHGISKRLLSTADEGEATFSCSAPGTPSVTSAPSALEATRVALPCCVPLFTPVPKVAIVAEELGAEPLQQECEISVAHHLYYVGEACDHGRETSISPITSL